MKKKGKFSFLIAVRISFIILLILMLVQFQNFIFATIYESQPDSSAGKDTTIYPDFGYNSYNDPTMIIGKSVAGKEYRSLIEFNVSAIPTGDSIVSAVLQVYFSSSTNNNNLTIKVYRLTSAWNITSVNWTSNNSNELWNSAGGDYNAVELNSTTMGNVYGFYNLTITSAVREWVNGTYPNYGLILASSDAVSGNRKYIDSSESTNASTRPKIIINHVENAPPEISSIVTDTNVTNLKAIGNNVTFTISWSDLELNLAKVYICNSSNISLSSGCVGKTFCNTSNSSSSPIQCNYNITAQENRTTSFWVKACDSYNCSEASSSYFYVNHLPNITLVSPNGYETINQTANGNYNITFNVSDADLDYLTADIYYGVNLTSTENNLYLDLNLSNYCTDSDVNMATTNICTYSWNTTGIYGNYSLTIILNDSFSTSRDSSDNFFRIVSLEDSTAPNITAQWLDSADISSGETVQIYANVSDVNMQTAWVSINTTPQTNLTMTNSTQGRYSINWTAVGVGTYKFKTYAIDRIGNLNDTMEWQEFNITKPVAVTQNETAPEKAIPYSVVRVTGKLNATNLLKEIYAYLNVPEGFVFLNDYPQNSHIGNFTENETKTATWFISSPITESTYTLNITYSDNYSNSWNSSNFDIQVTSAIGGYEVSAVGYPEVETGDGYYAEAKFKQGGTLINPDSITISLYDSTGVLVLGPAAMTQIATGEYNYSYTVGSSVNEGQWEARINATESSTSYYANQFFKVVGGPFDVRDVVVNDGSTPDLIVSVTTENTGGVSKDLTLTWNLTREDTGALITSGADTFAVDAYSTYIKTVNPSTTYVGQVRITFLGYYSGTEKAGAYKIFSTTAGTETPPVTSPSGGGGGGGGVTITKQPNFEMQNFESKISMTKNIQKTVSLDIKNTGQKDLTGISLDLEGLDKSYYTILPFPDSLAVGKTQKVIINLFIIDAEGEKIFNYVVKTNELTKKEPAKIIILTPKEFFLEESQKKKERINNLREQTTDKSAIEKINQCENLLTKLDLSIEKQNFVDAQNELKDVEECVSALEREMKKESLLEKIGEYQKWVVTVIIILILIVIIILILIYLFYKKWSLTNFLKMEAPPATKSVFRNWKDQDFDKRIKNIQKRISKL